MSTEGQVKIQLDGQRTEEQLSLTVWVLVVHHIQVIFIRFHISQQVVCRDITALCLLVVCGERNQHIPLGHGGIHTPRMCPRISKPPLQDTWIHSSLYPIAEPPVAGTCATSDDLRNSLRTVPTP